MNRRDMPDLSLAVGDRVVYPKQGLWLVSNVETQDIAGQRMVFVTLKREVDGAVVMVPESKVKSIGLRKVAEPKEVQEVIAFLLSDSDKAQLDWKLRARTNTDRMATGGLIGLAEVVKGLQVLSELRPLPPKERQLYDNARHLMITEISEALSVDSSTAEDIVDVILFPPGKERPKRTADEFKRPSEADDGLDLDDNFDQLGESDLDLVAPEEPEEESPSEPDSEEGSEEEAEKPKRGKSVKDSKTKSAKKVKAATTPSAKGKPAAQKVDKPKKTSAADKKMTGTKDKSKNDKKPARKKK